MCVRVTLDKVVREGLSEEVTFLPKLENENEKGPGM